MLMLWVPPGGNTNEELVNALEEDGSLHSACIKDAFMAIDRQHFTPDEEKIYAYHDRPLLHGRIHMSAPGMYATILEALKIEKGNCVLNIGSGSGYLSSLIGILAGKTGMADGIDLHEEILQYAQCRVDALDEQLRKRMGMIRFFLGNCILLDPDSMQIRYDRIYVGATGDTALLNKLKMLLKMDGRLIGPFESLSGVQELVKVTRTGSSTFVQEEISHVLFAPLVQPTEDDKALGHPRIDFAPWTKKADEYFPKSFRQVVFVLLCVARRCKVPVPKAIWLDVIIPFLRRDWFEN